MLAVEAIRRETSSVIQITKLMDGFWLASLQNTCWLGYQECTDIFTRKFDCFTISCFQLQLCKITLVIKITFILYNIETCLPKTLISSIACILHKVSGVTGSTKPSSGINLGSYLTRPTKSSFLSISFRNHYDRIKLVSFSLEFRIKL